MMSRKEFKTRILILLLLLLQICLAHRQGNRKWKKHEKYQFNFEEEDCTLPETCSVSLPQKTHESCHRQRLKDVAMSRYWYQITDASSPSPIKFPHKHTIPWLNQTTSNVDYFYATDPFESRYLMLAGTWFKAMLAIRDSVLAEFKTNEFFSYNEYKYVFGAFETAIKNLHRPKYFGAPTIDHFHTEIIFNDKWMSDDTFVQTFLTQQCPWSIMKVTKDGEVGITADEIFSKTNQEFIEDLFDDALTAARGESITKDEAIEKGMLFVLYHKEHDGLASHPDVLDRNASDTRKMIETTSTITYFVRHKEGELKVVAIQTDYTPDSPVFIPSSPKHEWQLAKAKAALSHQDVCQGYYHLGQMHYVGSVFCLVFRRHLSTLHPLHDVMKFHCEGTIPHITKAFPTLAYPTSYGHQFFAMAHQGFNVLSMRAYSERNYGMFDYDKWMKKQGIDEDSFKYHPWRDDGKLLWGEIQTFSRNLVKMYYKNDEEVTKDVELQSFANEMSPEGTQGPNAGKGKFTGFPSCFSSKKEVELFMTRFIWFIVIHTSVNYAIAPTFMPIRAPKLYKDTQESADKSFPHNLPDAEVTIGMTFLSDTLSHFRANRFMDYYDKVQDKKLQKLVYKTYSRLQKCIQKTMEERNEARKEKGRLGMQIFEPKWLVNSIHI